jgi:hypothetical protein
VRGEGEEGISIQRHIYHRPLVPGCEEALAMILAALGVGAARVGEHGVVQPHACVGVYGRVVRVDGSWNSVSLFIALQADLMTVANYYQGCPYSQDFLSS